MTANEESLGFGLLVVILGSWNLLQAFFTSFTPTEDVMFSPVIVGLLVGLLAGLHKNYMTYPHKD